MASNSNPMVVIRRIVVGLKRCEESDVTLAKFTDCLVNYFAPNQISVKVSCKLQDDMMIVSPATQCTSADVLSKEQKIKCLKDSDLSSVILQHSPECPVWKLPHFAGIEPISENILNRGIFVGVAVVTESSDGRILMTQRPDHMRAFPRAWVPPGGHLEVGENVIEGGFRELEEETGLKFDSNTCITRVLCLWESVYPVLLGIGSPKNHHIVIYLHTKLDESWEQLLMKMKLDPSEVQACTWLAEDDVRRLFASGKERSWVTKKYSPGPDGLVSNPSDLNLAQMFPASLWQDKHIYSGTQLALQQWLDHCQGKASINLASKF